MWSAANWEDYELIDCSGGEKLERWKDQILIRPDPQAIWVTPQNHPNWKSYHGRYRRSNTGGGHWGQNKMPARWTIDYGDLTFNLKPMNFKHTGIFPEQASNWDFARAQIEKANRPISVLNMFGYTGAASIACAASGAKVCHVDAAKGMVDWARENAISSHLEDAPIRWIVDDCVKFIQKEIRRGRKYDAIIMDPPSYGKGPKGEAWKIETNLFPFMELVAEVLSDEPLFLILNTYSTGLAPSVLTYLLETVISKKHGGKTESQELGLPVSETGLHLPCGATARWTATR